MRRPILSLLPLLAVLAAPVVHAETYCVDTATELRNALTFAAGSAEDDTIRVVRGTYTLPTSIEHLMQGALVLRGGYAAGCISRLPDPALTRLVDDDEQDANLFLRVAGDLLVEGLSFEDFYGVHFGDGTPSASARNGEMTIQRIRVLGGQYGLSVQSESKDVRIVNNLLVNNRSLCCGADHLNIGLQFRHQAANAPAIAVDILFNTMVGNPRGLKMVGGAPFDGTPRVQNNILRASGPSYSMRLDAIQIAATNNVIGLVETANGGGFAANLLNEAADPQLDAAFVPQAGSPALHSGTTFVAGGVPATDYDGTPRDIGSNPDRGAQESQVSDLGVLTVTSAANSGAGTLRQALLDSNQTTNAEVIRFNVAGGCPATITLTTPLPTVTSPVTIDGFSQPGSSPNESSTAYDGVHCVKVRSGEASHALRLQPPADRLQTVRGLQFEGFTDAQVIVEGAGSARVQGNVFTRYVVVGAVQPLDAIRVTGADGTEIGGDDAGQRNRIAYAQEAGVHLAGGAARIVRNNLIGLHADGYGDGGNGVGIHVVDGVGDQILDNVIGHSGAQGILVEGAASSDLEIEGNDIGWSLVANPDQVPSRDAGNATNGIRIAAGTSHRVASNRIAYNGTDGLVVLAAADRTHIVTNRIHDNAQLGIDLSPDGVDPQDSDLTDDGTGGNDGQNFPVLTAAAGSEQEGVVTGTLNSLSGSYRVLLYASANCDASGHGEGEGYIGGVTVVIPTVADLPVDGTASFSADVGNVFYGPGLIGKAITATASDDDGNTSEFSACIDYTPGPEVFADGFED